MRKGTFLILLIALFVSFGQISNTFAYSISNVGAQKTSTNSAKINWQKDTRSLSDYVIIKSTNNSFSKTVDLSCTETLSYDSIYSCINVTDLPTDLAFVYQVVSTFGTTLNSTNTSGSGATTQIQEVKSIEYPLILNPVTEIIPVVQVAPTSPSNVSAVISTQTAGTQTATPSVYLSWVKNGNASSTTIIRNDSNIYTFNNTSATSNSSYLDATVTYGNTYSYIIKVCTGNDSQLCSYSSSTQITIPTKTVPVAPATLSATLHSSSSINLTWVNTVSSTSNYFKVYVATSSPNFTSNEPYRLLTTITQPNTTSYLHSSLSSGSYTYGIEVCNEVGCSSRIYSSNVIVPVVSIIAPILTPPSKPDNTRIATSSNADGVITTLSWDYVYGTNKYKIISSQQGLNTSSVTLSELNSKIVGVNLTPGNYTYNVLACNTETNCSASSTVYLTITPINSINNTITRPAIPTGLIIATTTNSSANFYWTVNSGLTYNIKNSSTGVIYNKTSPYNTGTLSSGVYYYSVQACFTASSTTSSTNCSDFAQYVQIIIPEPVISKPKSPSSAFTSILPTDNNISNVRVSWTDESNNEDYFKITRTPLWSTQQSTQGYRTSNNSTYDDMSLSSGTYTYNISACSYTLGCSESTPASVIIIESPSRNLSGLFTLTDGKIISGAKVTAYNDTKSVDSFTDDFGKYTLTLPGGTYKIKVTQNSTMNASWIVDNNDVTISISSTDRILDFSARPLVSTLRTVVKDELGNFIPNIGVIVSNSNNVRINTQTTDTDGITSTLINAGGYVINTIFSESLPYIPAETQTISINNNETKEITFVLKKKDISNVFEVRGVSKFDDGIPTIAFISAWSDKGGQKSTYSSGVNGEFLLTLSTNDTWHISAKKDKDGKSYETTEVIVNKDNYTNPISLFFVKSDSETLPPPVIKTTVVTQSVKVEAKDGASIVLPANSTNSSGSIDVQVKPTTEAPSQKSSEVISTVYDITVKNNSGTNVTTLSSEAQITLPYNDNDLRAQGINVENLVPSYFDEKIGTWVSVPKFTIDKSKKTFTLFVQHLTRFALIASADTTAPSSPTNIVTDAITPTDIKISWNNPQNDFNHVKIYRSEKLGSYGDLIAAEVFANSFIDKTFSTVAKTYYYTIRAVDNAGNESNNSNQLASTILGDKFASKNKSNSLALPPGQASVGEITRRLVLGSKGDDVTALQKALKIDGFYVTGPITGYYGKLTKNAVTRFQNYYKNEILIPNGYKTGTGIVGEATRKKINEILANNS